MILLILNINKLNFRIDVITLKVLSQYTTHTVFFAVFSVDNKL